MPQPYKVRKIVESFTENKLSRDGTRIVEWPREKLDCGHVIKPPIEYRDHLDGPQATSGYTYGGAVEVIATRRRCYECGRATSIS